MTAATQRHDNNFDLLRMLFAYAVVFTHVRELSGGTSEFFLFSSSGWGVDGFFLISGFLVFRSWQNQPHFGAYGLKRLFRIYPAYITVIAVQCAILVALQWDDIRIPEVLRYLAANALFLNFLAPTVGDIFAELPFNAANGALWTLKIEVAFYVLMPAAVIVARRFLPIILLIAIIVSFAYYVTLLDLEQTRLANQLPGKTRLFALGMLLAIYGHRIPIWAYAIAAVAALGALQLGTTGFLSIDIAIRDLLLAAGIMAVAFATPHPPLPTDISFAVYLVHFPLIQLALVAGLASTIPAWAFLLAVLAAATLLALALALLVERPMLAIGTAWARAAGQAGATLIHDRTFRAP
ncbi:MAG: acyltransferase [Alphaproteobacteria bacterium]